MKKTAYILAALLVFAACAREEIHHPVESEAPQTASAYEPVISVDQELNQVTFSIDAKGVIPVWLFQNNSGEFAEYRAQNGFKRIYATAGDYTVRMKVMNAAGVTPDYVEKTFHIDNTIANFDRYITLLAGGMSGDNRRNWRVDGDVEGHMGCGPSGTAGTEWWSAVPQDKAAFGVYEDLLSFSGDGVYTYDPGEDGATYVNIDGVTVSPFIDQKGDATADYNARVEAQTTTYAFAFRGNDLYLTFPEHTLFPYIDNDDFWAAPEFQVLSITRETLELVHDNGSIAWHFVLTSKAAAYVFNGFKYNAESNLWLPADAAHSYSYYYAPEWNQIADPETSLENGEYTLSLPAATFDRWQAQFFIIPDEPVVLSADKRYDFSVIVNSTTTIPDMTFKLTDVGDDGNFLFDKQQTINAGETCIFWLSDLEGIDAPNGVKMVFDFGRNPENTVVSLANIVLKDHAVDDGTILPGDEPGDDTDDDNGGAHYDIEGDTNFWRSMEYTMSFYTAFGNDWAGLPDSGFEADDARYVYTVSMPEETHNQWQRQVAFHTDMRSVADKHYDFCCTLTPTMDLPGVTFKLVLDGGGENDSIFYFEERHDLTAFEPFVLRKPDMPGIDMDAIALFFDFGGNPAGAEVEIKDVCFQEHQAPQGDGSYGDNVWTGSYLKETWFSAADWSGGLDPQAVYENGTLTLVVPEGVGGFEWQGQVKLVADIAADPDTAYAFRCKIESSSDGVCTVKVADANDDSAHDFFHDDGVSLTAYDVVSYGKAPVSPDQAYAAVMVIFDFGRMPAGTEITVTDIALCPAI